jgi:hypothetical protein
MNDTKNDRVHFTAKNFRDRSDKLRLQFYVQSRSKFRIECILSHCAAVLNCIRRSPISVGRRERWWGPLFRLCVIASRSPSKLTIAHLPSESYKPHIPHQNVGQDREDDTATAGEVCDPLSSAPYPPLTPPQNRRRPILRSAPAAARNRLPIHQSTRLGLGHRYPLPRRAGAAASWPGRLRRRPVHLSARSISQGRSQARCQQQEQAAELAARLPQG